MVNVEKELAALEAMTVDQLRRKYGEVFGEETRSRHKVHLVKRIIWRIQANAEGGLSERALRRAMELANDADLRLTAPRPRKPAPDADQRTVTVPSSIKPSRELLPGTVLQRIYKGRTVRVMKLADGFEFEGERFGSLTAVAEGVTGKHWNGHHFFGLRGRKKEVAK